MDASGAMLPQRPLPPYLFHSNLAHNWANLKMESDPTYLDLGHLSQQSNVLIHSGRILRELRRYVREDYSDVALLEDTLRWRHLAPCAPDTLPCYPKFDSDPFIVSACPDIYIVGGQERFSTSLISLPENRGCRIVVLSDFADTGLVVLVNKTTLEIKTQFLV